MAIFPQGLTAIDARCNAGERRVLHQLKRCLEDDYIVWHDIPIGVRARQPDFVVLSPRWGVLLLEVKDWKLGSLGPGNRDALELRTARGPLTVAHPLRQARDYTLELVDLMQRDPVLVHAQGPFAGRLLFPYGWGVVMSHLYAADVAGSDFATLFAEHRTLLRDDLAPELDRGQFQHRLWGMFTVSYPYTLTLPQRDRIRWHLFPEVRLPAQGSLDLELSQAPSQVPAATAANAAPATTALPTLLEVMDLQQEQIARTLGEGHRVIHGAAGSGKTMILLFRAQFLAATARPDQPILVLCFNRTLATRIDSLLRQRGVDERVQVRTFHAWCQDMVRSYQIDVPGAVPGKRDHAYFEALAAAVERAVDNGRVPAGQYHALLIDEAHDFEEAWLRMAARMVAPQTNSLLVLYDDAQSIYQSRRRKFNFASVGIEARGRTSVLRLNYRNTAEVLALAVQCAQSLLAPPQPHRDAAPVWAREAGVAAASREADDAMPTVQPASAGRRGPLPVLVRERNVRREAEAVAERLRQAAEAGLAWRDAAVMAPQRAQLNVLAAALRRAGIPLQTMSGSDFRRFDWRAQSVKLMTLHSAKGLEFPWVAVSGLEALPLPGQSAEDALRLLYVAMTRATGTLMLSAAGETPLVLRVAQALQATAEQFAAAA